MRTETRRQPSKSRSQTVQVLMGFTDSDPGLRCHGLRLTRRMRMMVCVGCAEEALLRGEETVSGIAGGIAKRLSSFLSAMPPDQTTRTSTGPGGEELEDSAPLEGIILQDQMIRGRDSKSNSALIGSDHHPSKIIGSCSLRHCQ